MCYSHTLKFQMIQIDTNILIAWGAVARKYKKGEMIFWEGDLAHFFYQIHSGAVKMFNINDEGREFTQGFFEQGSSFGEPPLFFQGHYPASAATLKDSVIYKLQVDSFHRLLAEYPDIHQNITRTFANRLYEKSCMAREMINSPESRILALLKKIKKHTGERASRIRIQYTRQEIANSTGLRVETVIRTLTRMEKESKVEIKGHKLYY
jgi:CRP-like cAMP-binding protein